MPRRAFPMETMINLLQETEVVLARGESLEAICRKLSITRQAYDRWRMSCGGKRTELAKRSEMSFSTVGVTGSIPVSPIPTGQLHSQVNAAGMQPSADGYRSRVEGEHRGLERLHDAGIELYAASAAQLFARQVGGRCRPIRAR